MNTGIYALPDIEMGIRTWLRTLDTVTAIAGQRIFLGLPRRGPSAWPAISLFRVGGGPEDGDYPIDRARLQIDCWGNIGDKKTCYQLAQAVAACLLDMPCGTLLGSAVRGMGVFGVEMPYQPDSDSGRPRYSVQCVIQAQALVAPV